MKHLTWISIILLLNQGCLDTIELDLPASPTGRTVVEGSVQRSEDDYVFRAAVRRTVEVVGELVFELERADISILLNDQPVLSLLNNEDVRMSIQQFHANYGGDPETALFKLSAKLGDGRTIESENQKILEPPRSSTLEVGLDTRLLKNSADNIIDATFVELFINSPLINERGERLSYLWEVSGVYRFPELAWTDNPFWFSKICYIPVGATLNQVNVVSSADINTNELNRYKINERSAGYQYHSGYYYTVILKAIDANAAEYWKQVAASIKRDGTLFDTPPGKIRTNLRSVSDDSGEQVLGYFYTAGIDTVRHLATPRSTGFQRHLCNPLDSMEGPCCDCLDGFRNSTLEKPHYWN